LPWSLRRSSPPTVPFWPLGGSPRAPSLWRRGRGHADHVTPGRGAHVVRGADPVEVRYARGQAALGELGLVRERDRDPPPVDRPFFAPDAELRLVVAVVRPRQRYIDVERREADGRKVRRRRRRRVRGRDRRLVAPTRDTL